MTKSFCLRSFILVYCGISHSPSALATEYNCQKLLSGSGAPQTFSRTLQQIDQIVFELAQLKIRIDREKTSERNSIAFFKLAELFKQKEQEASDLARFSNTMNQAQLIERIKQQILFIQAESKKSQAPIEIKEDSRRLEEKTQIRKTTIDGNLAIFHKVEPDSFRMVTVTRFQGKSTPESADITLTKPFAMMATPVTYRIWNSLEELSGTKIGEGHEMFSRSKKTYPENYPVVWVSRPMVQEWINSLNQLSQNSHIDLSEIIPDHQTGDIYDLPTEAQWDFVVRERGLHKGEKPNVDSHYPHQYLNKARYALHPVAVTEPLRIGMSEFFDLNGDIGEMVRDYYSSTLSGGIDPEGPLSSQNGNNLYTVRGGAAELQTPTDQLTYRKDWTLNTSSSSVTFRLVRVLK